MRPQQNKWDRQNRPASELTKAKFQKILKSQKQLRDSDRFYDLAAFEKATGRLVGTVAAMDILRRDWVDLVMYSATCEEFGVKWKGIPQTRLR